MASVTLICENCLSRNYKTQKNKLKLTSRLELNKYCKHCNCVTLHKESK